MDDPANSTTTPPEPFWHAENKTEPVTAPIETPPPPPPPTPIPEPTITIPVIPTVPEPPVIPTPSVDPMPPPPESMMRTVPPVEAVVVIKPKKGGSGAKVVLGVLIFLIISVTGVLGYMAIQKGGLPFNLNKKATGCDDALKYCGLNGLCGASNDCACFSDINNCIFQDWSCCSTKSPLQPPGAPTPTSAPGEPTCVVTKGDPEGSAGPCIKADGAEVKIRACLNSVNCTGGNRSVTYLRTVANCSGTSCAGTCGNAGETRTLTVPPGEMCVEETVGCSVTNKCGNCQVDVDSYGERAWQDSGCTSPTNTPKPTVTTTPVPTPTISCVWCGADCVDSRIKKSCLDVMPPAGATCELVNGVCKKTIPTATLTPGPKPTPTPTTTPIPGVVTCVDVTVIKKGTTSLTGLIPGDTVVITVTASGLVPDMAIRLKKDGKTIEEFFYSVEHPIGTRISSWQKEYTIPLVGGAGNYEAQGFIKDGGVWK